MEMPLNIRRIGLLIKKEIKNNRSVADDCILINTKRIYFSSILAIILHVVQFVFFFSSTSVNALWRNIILYSNIIMLFLLGNGFIICKPSETTVNAVGH